MTACGINYSCTQVMQSGFARIELDQRTSLYDLIQFAPLIQYH
jgi:hypothetical protein